MDIKERMANVGMTQVDMILELQKRGYAVQPPILLRGTLPFKGKNNLAGVEIYKAARYFIMTGNTLLYREIIENQEAIDYVVEKYFPEARETSDKVVVGRDKIYAPVWEEPVVNGRVKLRPVYPRIPDGSRNICLTSLAGMLHNQGYSKSQIYEELLYANTVACDPPLDRNELRTMVYMGLPFPGLVAAFPWLVGTPPGGD